MRTGVPYSVRILREAVGLELLPWARTQDTMEPRAPLKAEILCRTFGILPLVDLRTPTCSACSTNSILHPFIVIGLYSALSLIFGGSISISLVFVEESWTLYFVQ